MSYTYDRTAAGADTLLAAKLAWAKTVAEKAGKWFKSGGWSNQRARIDIEVAFRTVELTVTSERYGWTGYATFNMGDDKAFVDAWVSLERPKGERDEDVNLFEVLDNLNTRTKRIPIDDLDDSDKIVSAISLWFSQTVNKIPT